MTKIMLIIYIVTATGSEQYISVAESESILACQEQAQMIWDNNSGSNIDAKCYYTGE